MRVKVDPLDSWVSVIVDELLSPGERSRAVADFARKALMDAQAANERTFGQEAPFEQFVDGRKGGALDTVNPDTGKIVFEFEFLGDVLQWIMLALVERSPKRSGRYRAGHKLFADGREIDAGGTAPLAREYAFTNYLPYARRLEVGKTESGRDFLVSVPNRIYERTAKDARSRFGNIAKIGITYRGVAGGGFVGGRAGNKSRLRYPTITVTPN